MIVTSRFGKKTNKNGNRKKIRGGKFIAGGTSNPDSRVAKANFLSDQNFDGNCRILLPSFRLLRKYNTYFQFLTREDYFQSELKQMTAEFSNNSDWNSGQESRLKPTQANFLSDRGIQMVILEFCCRYFVYYWEI